MCAVPSEVKWATGAVQGAGGCEGLGLGALKEFLVCPQAQEPRACCRQDCGRWVELTSER